MQKVISFDKSFEFKTMVGEVTSISLDPKLEFSDDSTISGELIISGKYKLTAASRLEDDFIFHLPIDIVLTESLEEGSRKVLVDDFRYEVKEDDTLECHIDLLVEGVEKIDVEDDLDDVRDGTSLGNSVQEMNDSQEKLDKISEKSRDELIVPQKEEKVETVQKDTKIVATEEEDVDTNQDVGSLFSSFKDSDESFATYSVYIVRQNDTVELIMDKYQVTREELENYNDLSNLSIGSKIIVPTHAHE